MHPVQAVAMSLFEADFAIGFSLALHHADQIGLDLYC